MGRIVPRSGHVPTTTSAPASRSRRTAFWRCRTASAGLAWVVTSLAPTKMTAMSGFSLRARSTWRERSADTAPDLPYTPSRTERSATAASPRASSTAGVRTGSVMPRPTDVESPSMTMRMGSMGVPVASWLGQSP